jgi:hypothetical protein
MKVIGLLHEIIYDGPISFFKPFLFSFKLRGRCRFSQCSFSERKITFLFLFGFLFSASVVSNSVIHSRGTSIQIKLFVNSTLQLSWFQRIFIRDPPVVSISLVVTSSWSLRRRKTFFQLQKFYHAQQGKHQASKLFVSRHDRQPSKVGPSTLFYWWAQLCTTFWESEFSTGQATWFQIPFVGREITNRFSVNFKFIIAFFFRAPNLHFVYSCKELI